jgi:hypothetical protein
MGRAAIVNYCDKTGVAFIMYRTTKPLAGTAREIATRSNDWNEKQHAESGDGGGAIILSSVSAVSGAVIGFLLAGAVSLAISLLACTLIGTIVGCKLGRAGL